jgi:hypothetical protein
MTVRPRAAGSGAATSLVTSAPGPTAEGGQVDRSIEVRTYRRTCGTQDECQQESDQSAGDGGDGQQ